MAIISSKGQGNSPPQRKAAPKSSRADSTAVNPEQSNASEQPTASHQEGPQTQQGQPEETHPNRSERSQQDQSQQDQAQQDQAQQDQAQSDQSQVNASRSGTAEARSSSPPSSEPRAATSNSPPTDLTPAINSSIPASAQESQAQIAGSKPKHSKTRKSKPRQARSIPSQPEPSSSTASNPSDSATADRALLTPEVRPEEGSKSEESLRPESIQDYVGQKALKEVITIAIQAAKARRESLDHLLLYGPPGLGKTTMSLVLAQEMGVNCKITTAPALERPRDIVGLLMSLEAGDLLFIDEIHRLPKVTEEILYPAMEDFRIDITIGKGQGARTRSLPLKPFTLVGATTQIGALTAPLRDRFGLVQRLRFYELDELTRIVQRTAQLLNTPINAAGAEAIARRSRGTPRIANRLLKRVRDYGEVKKVGTITAEVAGTALELYNVDPCGLDWIDRRLLSVMIENYNGGPVGLETLAAATGEDSHTIEEVYEPYLLQIGYLQRTPRGRIATPAAWTHLGYAAPITATPLKIPGLEP